MIKWILFWVALVVILGVFIVCMIKPPSPAKQNAEMLSTQQQILGELERQTQLLADMSNDAVIEQE